MRKYLLASAAALAALAAPSLADVTTSANATVSGDIVLKCTLSITNGTLALGDISTDGTGKHAGGMTNGTAFLNGTAMCNGAKNTVVVAAIPLTTTTTPVGSGFTSRIDYTLAVGTLLPGPVSLDTSAPATATSTQNNVGAFANSDSAGAAFATKATALPVMAGDYSATVTVTLTAGN